MSNLLEKASIITTPTAYSDGKLHSVKPKEVLGSELVTNGDFSNGSTGWSSYGTVDISNGIATIGASSNSGIFQGVLTQSKLYKVTLDVLSYNSVGNVQIINDAGFVLYSITQTGTHTFYFKHSISNANIIFRGISNALFSIDNISIKEATNADFDFQRGSAATRVNSQGLIENVQTLSGNLVQNGDFSEIGSELVTNGDFATDSDWNNNVGNDWQIVNGKLILTTTSSNNVNQGIGLVQNKFYKIVFTISNTTLGGVRIRLGTSSFTSTYTDGTHTLYLQQTTTNDAFRFYANSSGVFTGSIDNVSVKEVGQNWSFINGTNIGDNKAIISGDGSLAGRIEQLNVFASGKTYKITLDSIINSGGGLNVKYGVAYASNIGSILTTGSYTFYYTASSNQPLIISRKTGGVAYDSSVTNISVIEITDDTNLPRIDYTDGCGSLLLEPQSTNLINYSEDFSDSSWTLFGTIQANSSVSPNGLTTATKLTHTHSQYNMLRVVIGGVRTTSVFVKNVDADNFYIRGGGSGYAYYNFNTKTVNNNSLKVEYFANDWIRLSLTDSITTRQFGIGVNESDLSESGNSVYVWGAQLEDKSYATSYIPTNGSTVTRLADLCNNAGSSDLINSTEGVLYAEVEALANDGTYKLLEINNGGSTNRVYIAYLSNSVYVSVIVGGVPQFAESTSINSVTEFNKIAVKYKENDFALWINGIEVASDTNGVTSSIGVLNSIDFSNSSNGIPFYGNVKSLVVFKEALTNDELEGLTGEGYDTFNALALANNYTII